jgi:hypothetical protein
MSEANFAVLEAQFLSGAIADEFLPQAAARGFDDLIVDSWSTPVCRWITRYLCTGIFCPNPGTTRDPTTCPSPR